MFHPGQKVECIDASPACNGDPSLLEKGRIYTVSQYGETLRGPYVLLHEVSPGLGYIGWRIVRFRPIVERKTDISEFTKMLKPEKVDA